MLLSSNNFVRRRPQKGSPAPPGGGGARPWWHNRWWLPVLLLGLLHYVARAAGSTFDPEQELAPEGELEWARVPEENVRLEAQTDLCEFRWALDFQVDGFGCRNITPATTTTPRPIYDPPWDPPRPPPPVYYVDSARDVRLDFLLDLQIDKVERLGPPGIHHTTRCPGWLVANDLVLVNAHCVGGDSAFQVPLTIKIRKRDNTGRDKWHQWEGVRTCWSRALWDYGRPRAPFEMAMVKLDRPITDFKSQHADVKPVCLARGLLSGGGNSPLGGPELAQKWPQGKCAMVSFCRESFEEHSFGYDENREFLKLTPVRRLSRHECSRWEPPENGVNTTVSRLLACYESLLGLPIKWNSCRTETQRAVFCFEKPQAWEGPDAITCPCEEAPGIHTYETQLAHKAYLVAVGAQTMYPPWVRKYIDKEEMPHNLGTFVDLLAMHNMMRDLAVDTALHKDGGSYRTVCRNLGEKFGKPERHALIHNSGHQKKPNYAFEDNAILDRDIWVDAFNPRKCWSNVTQLLPQSAFMCAPDHDDEKRDGSKHDSNRSQTASHWEMPEGRRLPYLVDLSVAKIERNFADRNYSKQHWSKCLAYLLNPDVALTTAACVAPEHHLDEVKVAQLDFHYKGKIWGSRDRLVDKICWMRPRAPFGQFKPVELAVLHWRNPVTYEAGWVQPACLSGALRAPLERPACALVASCQDAKEPVEEVQVARTVALPVHETEACRVDLRVNEKQLPERHREPRSKFHVRQTTCYRNHHTRPLRPLCPTDSTRELTRSVVCWDQCDPGRQKTAYLAAIAPGLEPRSRSQDVTYDARGNSLEVHDLESPGNPAGLWAGIDLEASESQIRELLLALKGDHEGTREVVCQTMAAAMLW